MDKRNIIKRIIPRRIRETIKNLAGITALQERNAQLQELNAQFEIDFMFLKEHIAQLEECLQDKSIESIDYYFSLKKLNRKLAALKYLLHDNSIETMPQWVSFQNTHICNLRCPHCQMHGTEERHRKFNDKEFNMPDEMLKRTAKEALPGANEFTLTIHGEPLASPHFDKTLQELSQYGAKLELITNATLFTKERLALLIPGAGSICISIDGATEFTVEAIHLGSKFKKLLHNIRLLTRTIELLPENLKPKISFSYVIMGSNLRELPEIVRLAHLLGVPTVNCVFVVIFYDHIKNEAVELHKSLYNAYYEKAKEMAENLGIIINLPPPFKEVEASANSPLGGENMIIEQVPENYYETLSPPESFLNLNTIEDDAAEIANLVIDRVSQSTPVGEYISAKDKLQKMRVNFVRLLEKYKPQLKEIITKGEEKIKYCHYLHRCIFVAHSGEIFPCCIMGRPILGNINLNTVSEVWNGEAYNKFREQFFSQNVFDCCNNCIHIRYFEKNLLIKEIFG
jgi:MoaA/NifB/PqqE/SkfB family radical SAM enzyme